MVLDHPAVHAQRGIDEIIIQALQELCAPRLAILIQPKTNTGLASAASCFSPFLAITTSQKSRRGPEEGPCSDADEILVN